MTQQLASNAWTMFWSGGSPNSGALDIPELEDHWRNVAKVIPEQSKILDLCCGNGIVARYLRSASKALEIVGVDRAEVSTPKDLSVSGALGTVSLIGGVDILELPFTNQSFDVLTSLYGVEYSSDALKSKALTNSLRRGGRVEFVLHSTTSEVVRAGSVRKSELSRLLKNGGVVSCLERYLRGVHSIDLLNQACTEYLESSSIKTRSASAQVLDGVVQLQKIFAFDKKKAMLLGASFVARIQAEVERLTQLQIAALSANDIDIIIAVLDLAEVNVYKIMCGTDQDVGWAISGVK